MRSRRLISPTPGRPLAIEALLGKKPAQDLAASGQRSMLERVKSLKDLVVMNDEAHHVHDEDLEWSQSLLSIHRALPKGLALWLDFSATPKDQNGMYFPWTVCDYPLAQAVDSPGRHRRWRATARPRAAGKHHQQGHRSSEASEPLRGAVPKIAELTIDRRAPKRSAEAPNSPQSTFEPG